MDELGPLQRRIEELEAENTKLKRLYTGCVVCCRFY